MIHFEERHCAHRLIMSPCKIAAGPPDPSHEAPDHFFTSKDSFFADCAALRHALMPEVRRQSPGWSGLALMSSVRAHEAVRNTEQRRAKQTSVLRGCRMDDEALNNNAVHPPSMAWTPRITISRCSRLPKIRTDNAAMAAAFEHAHQHSSSTAQSQGPRLGSHQPAMLPNDAAPLVREAGQPLPLLPQAYRAETQHAGALPPVIQLQSFQSLPADSLGGDQHCRSPMPHRRTSEEDTSGMLQFRSLALPSTSPSFLGAAAQLLQSPPASGAAAKDPNSQPTMPQYFAPHEGKW